MNPQQWNELSESGARGVFKKAVEHHTRLYLATLAPGVTLTTNQLVEALYPRNVAAQSLTGDNTRNNIYRVVGQLALEGLEDCCMKGEVSGSYFGKPKRPWIWFAPEEQPRCCMCGQTMPGEDQ